MVHELEPAINLDLYGFLWSLGIQYICGNLRSFSVNLMLNLVKELVWFPVTASGEYCCSSYVRLAFLFLSELIPSLILPFSCISLLLNKFCIAFLSLIKSAFVSNCFLTYLKYPRYFQSRDIFEQIEWVEGQGNINFIWKYKNNNL